MLLSISSPGTIRTSLVSAALTLTLLAGCVPVSRKQSDAPPDINANSDSAKSVASEDNVTNQVVWVEKGMTQEDVEIDLGYRRQVVNDVLWLEPVAVITRDGTPVADAMVFNRLNLTKSNDEGADELATLYGHAADSDILCYAHGKLRVPAGVSQCAIHFRIVLPDGQQTWTYDLPVLLK